MSSISSPLQRNSAGGLPVRSADESTLDERAAMPSSSSPPQDGVETEVERNPVDVLADEFTARLRSGESPSIDEYVRRAPQHEVAIRVIFASIAMLEGAGQQQKAARQVERQLDRLGTPGHEQLGDFRIVREIGRGGMGVVYEAEQRSLNRRVALKVLGTVESATERQRLRFQREAESAARLHHTNIVPVFAIGEENGILFFAMQYIDGVPLSRTIQALQNRTPNVERNSNWAFERTQLVSQADFTGATITEGAVAGPPHPESASSSLANRTTTPEKTHTDDAAIPSSTRKSSADSLPFARSNFDHFRHVAQMGVQVAQALAYAHQHGMLHRDIKPGNLMLDRGGNVWITDFGLVKLADHDDLTGAGDLIGTLRYMAPEQFEGKSDERTDIYALGLTLFELLTLRPAFEGDQRTAFAKRIREQSVPRPKSLSPAIPCDLDTILIKATASDPSARYANAALLAEDLQRFLDDRPILARRESLVARWWRWSRRDPALASVTALAMLLLMAVAGVEWNARRRVETALEETSTARQRAENNVDHAIDAFDSILENITARGVPRSLALDLPPSEVGLSQASLSDADAELLKRLLSFYQKFAEENAQNGRLRERVAQAYHRTGEILMRLGELTAAEKNFRQAAELLDALRAEQPPTADQIALAAHLHNELGELMLRRGYFDETFNEHLEARAVVLEQSELIRQAPAVRFEFARATDLFASIDVRSGTNEVSFESRERRRDQDGPPGRANGPPSGRGPETRPPPNGDRRPPPDRDRGLPPNDRRGPPPDHPDRPPPDFGDGPPNREGPPKNRIHGAMPPQMEREGGDASRALAEILDDASNEFLALSREFPENATYQFALAQCLRHRLVHASSTKQNEAAGTSFLEAVRILESLVAKSPNDPKYLFELADTLTHAPRARTASEADPFLQRAVTEASQLATRFPNVTEYQLLIGTALARRAAVQESLSDIPAAEANLALALEKLKPLAERFPDQGLIQIPLAQTRRQLGDLLRNSAIGGDKIARLNQSRAILDQAVCTFDIYFTNSSATEFNLQTRTSLYKSLAQTLTQLDLPQEAESARLKSASDC